MSSEDVTPSSAAEQHITFNVKASSDAKYVLTVPSNMTVADLKSKLSTSDYADVPVERLRLIYSGRVLKDPDTLGSYKIKDGHTVHLVKGAASNMRQNPANQGSSSTAGSTPTPAANIPTNMAAGTGNNPLAALTGARYAGFHGLPSASAFGADGGMGAPPNSEELIRMMEDPNFMQTMNEMMNNPAFQQMLEQSPAVRNNPMARQMLRDPHFRRILFDPRMMRMQLEMDRAMGGGGGGGGGAPAFPAPGVTDTTPQTGGATGDRPTGDGQQAQNTGAAGAQHPFANLFGGPPAGGAGGQANPFAALFGMPPPQTTGTTGTSSPPPTGMDANQPNPSMARMMEALSLLNQYAAQGQGPAAGADGSNTSAAAPGNDTGSPATANNPFAGLFNPWEMQPPAPPDNRPPEERYAEQLRQLNDMGFFEFERNVQALRRSGGSVQGALEWLLSDGGT